MAKASDFDRLTSEKDKLFQQIQNKEIGKVRKELNRKIIENSRREKRKMKNVSKVGERKKQKSMNEWLKKELRKKKIEDSKAKQSNLEEKIKQKEIEESIKKELDRKISKNNFEKRKESFKELNKKIEKSFPEVKKEVKSSKPSFLQKTIQELKGSFDFGKKEKRPDSETSSSLRHSSETDAKEELKEQGSKKIKVEQFFEEKSEKEKQKSQEIKGENSKNKFKQLESSTFPKQEVKVHAPYLRELEEMKKEIAKVVVGQDKIVEDVLRAIISDGHVLIEGVPGVAKTLLIRAISETVGCRFARIQFTVDLLPTDITGITTYTPGKGFETIKGPIFTNFVIADEINRAPPKTQSALLEAMQERQVTIGKETFKLEPPFFVMANNNPIERSGVYKLPEAQMDRFLFKLNMGYPKSEEEQRIIDQNITLQKFEDFKIKKILSPQKIFQLQKMVKEVQASPQIKKYIVELVQATRKFKEYNINLGKYIEWGGSPRASIALYIGAKADAVLRGQKVITPQNVKNVAHIALRHRILLNYAGQAENINTDHIIDEILSKVQIP